jgi:hypothetical protein
MGLLRSTLLRSYLPHSRPRRLAWPRTSPFHGGNTGSNPVGDANKIKNLLRSRPFSGEHNRGHNNSPLGFSMSRIIATTFSWACDWSASSSWHKTSMVIRAERGHSHFCTTFTSSPLAGGEERKHDIADFRPRTLRSLAQPPTVLLFHG